MSLSCEDLPMCKVDQLFRSRYPPASSDPLHRIDGAGIAPSATLVTNGVTCPSAEDFGSIVNDAPEVSSQLFNERKSKRKERLAFPMLDGNEEEADTDSERVPTPLMCYSHLADMESESDTESIARCKSPERWACGSASKFEMSSAASQLGHYDSLELEQAHLAEQNHGFHLCLGVVVAATSVYQCSSSNSSVLTPMSPGKVHNIPSASGPYQATCAMDAQTTSPSGVVDSVEVVPQELAHRHSRPRSRQRQTLQLSELVDAVSAKAMPQTVLQQNQQLHQQPSQQHPPPPSLPQHKHIHQSQSERHQPSQLQQQRQRSHQQWQRFSSKKSSDTGETPAMEPCDPTWTTLMIRNIPNNYTREMLLATFCQEGFEGMYDFVYLPIDFSTSAALGYAFLNLVSHNTARHFWERFSGFSKWSIPSKKSCDLCWCQPYQGLAANIEHYRNSPVIHPSVLDEHKPQIFKGGVVVDFPPPTKSLRAPRLRGHGKEKSQKHKSASAKVCGA